MNVDGVDEVRCDAEFARTAVGTSRPAAWPASPRTGRASTINAIPAVCAAAPGIVTYMDLPLITAMGFVHTG